MSGWFTGPFLEWKLLRIEFALKSLMNDAGVKSLVRSYGAHYIDPGQLVLVACVSLDRDRDMLRNNYRLSLQMRKLLDRFNWPVAVRDKVRFDIESQETVDREYNGNWRCHYIFR